MDFWQDCLIILPAAGFGTRVGSPNAKELLIRPSNQLPLIDQPIIWAKNNNIQCHVITRKEKHSLLKHLHKMHSATSVQQIEVEGEWPQTILKSKAYWKEYNLVCLPDSEFAPQNIMKDLLLDLKTYQTAFAIFQVEDLSKWGVVYYRDQFLYICEKPSLSLVTNPTLNSSQSNFQKSESNQSVSPRLDQTPYPTSSSTQSSRQASSSNLFANQKLNKQLDIDQNQFQEVQLSPRAWGLFAFRKDQGEALLSAMIDSGLDHQFKKIKSNTHFRTLHHFEDLTRG